MPKPRFAAVAVGGVIGGVIFTAAVVAVLFAWKLRQRRRRHVCEGLESVAVPLGAGNMPTTSDASQTAASSEAGPRIIHSDAQPPTYSLPGAISAQPYGPSAIIGTQVSVPALLAMFNNIASGLPGTVSEDLPRYDEL